ncbi:MAG: hypothetical protein ACOZQL_31750 [Myxococcota bacterium]
MTALLFAHLVFAAAPEMRRETNLDFATDEAFQAQGGVQYYYELAAPNDAPPESSALARFRALDPQATPKDPYHVVMGRIEYTVERDVSYFTEARARDVTYLRKVAPEMGVRREPDGAFRVSKSPSNRFTISWFDAPEPDGDAFLRRFFAFLPGKPASVVVQRNEQFARVLGFRTAERALTYTAHLPLGPGRTRVSVITMSLLVNLPPDFLGGPNRIIEESVEGAQTLIRQLREYSGP